MLFFGGEGVFAQFYTESFSDDFNRSELGTNWQNVVGISSIVNNTLEVNSNSYNPVGLQTLNKSGLTQTVSFDMLNNASRNYKGDFYVAFRVQGKASVLIGLGFSP